MKLAVKMLTIAVTTCALTFSLYSRAEQPAQCPCDMNVVIQKLADMISKGAPEHDQQASKCDVLVDTISPGSGERWESAVFGNQFSSADKAIDGIYYSVSYYSIGYLPDEPTNGQCLSYTVDDGLQTTISNNLSEPQYEACKDEWLHLVNMYNALPSGKNCTREAINAYRKVQDVNYTAP